MTETLNFKFSVILITLKVNEQSHTRLVAPVEPDSAGGGRGSADCSVFSSGSSMGPGRAEEWDPCFGDLRKKMTTCPLKESTRAGRKISTRFLRGEDLGPSRPHDMPG